LTEEQGGRSVSFRRSQWRSAGTARNVFRSALQRHYRQLSF